MLLAQWRWGRLIKLTNSSRSKSHSGAHPSPSSAPEHYYFLFQGFAPLRWTWTNLSWSCANKRVGEREGKTGPGEIKASAAAPRTSASRLSSLLALFTCTPRTKTNSIPHGCIEVRAVMHGVQLS
jgi:hypothetical protein